MGFNYWSQLDRVEAQNDYIIQQNDLILNNIKKVLGNELTEQRKLSELMAAVQIEQDDLDAVGSALETLVETVKQIDTSQLPAADKTKLSQGLTDLTTAINDKLSPTTPVDPPVDGDV